MLYQGGNALTIRNALLAGAGTCLLAMGAVGLALPVWPTTPFVLAAAGCFASMPRLHARVMRIPFVNEYIRNAQDRKGVSRRTVTVSLLFLWSMLMISVLHLRTLWITGCLAIVGIAVTAHILWVSKPRR